MKHTIVLCALIAIGCKTAAEETTAAADVLFCPACAKFCGGEACPAGPGGNCAACGRTPATVKAVATRDYWCSEHAAWHAAPCSMENCCAGQAGYALIVPRGTRTQMTAFCPANACACGGPNCPVGGDGACVACGKAPMSVETVETSWFWCTHERRWLRDAPAPIDAELHCCEPFRVRVRVAPRQAD